MNQNSKPSNNYVLQNICLHKSASSYNVSYLRAVGLISAISPWVICASDNVMFEPEYFNEIVTKTTNQQWGFCKRKIWRSLLNHQFECIGVDDFDSTINSDNKININCMFFNKKMGATMASLLRENISANNGKTIYNFLNKYAGSPYVMTEPFVNYVCTPSMVNYFNDKCTP